MQPLYCILFQEFGIWKQTILKKQEDNKYFLILAILLLFKRITAWQTLKSQSLNQTVNLLQQLCEVGICIAFLPLLLSKAENSSGWNHSPSGQLQQLFPPLVPHRPAQVTICSWGWTICFCEGYNIVYKNPNCCFDLYDLTLNHRSIIMFKTLIDSTCFKYSDTFYIYYQGSIKMT